jgi:hypothetical protein
MTTLLFANNAKTVLALPVLFTDTAVTVATGTGNTFPAPGVNESVILTFNSALNSAINEIVRCTNITGDVLTIVRAQEGTVARNWAVGDFIANLFTAGTAAYFPQFGYGTTAQRPTFNVVLAQYYFDSTLGIPIYCKTISPSITWVNSAGVLV